MAFRNSGVPGGDEMNIDILGLICAARTSKAHKKIMLGMLINLDDAFTRAQNDDLTGIDEFRDLYCLNDNMDKIKKLMETE
jgi:hypothetical protein